METFHTVYLQSLIILWVLLLECLPYEQKTSISLTNVWNQKYKLGGNLTLPCNVYGLKKGQYVQFVRLIDGEDYLVSNDTRLSPEVRKTRRYKIEKAVLNSKTMVILKIIGIQSSDGGRLGCKIGPDGLTAYTGSEISVYVPIHSVVISYKLANGSYTKVQSNDQVHLRSTYYRLGSGIKCEVIVKGGSVEPQIYLTLGRQNVVGRFKREVEKKWDHTDGGMLVRGYAVVMTYETFHPSIWDNNKLLACRAKVPLYEAKELTVKVNVSYPPRFECRRSKFYGWAGDTRKSISCFVRLNPTYKFASWWWRSGSNEQHISVKETKDGYTARVKVMGINTLEFSLTIDEVEHYHFHAYFLEVDNGFGLMHQELRLFEGNDPDTCSIIAAKENAILVGVSLATGYLTHGYGYT